MAQAAGDEGAKGEVVVTAAVRMPVACHSFGGWKRSGFGDLNQYGDGVRFYTRQKIVTQRWPKSRSLASGVTEQSFVIPTMR